MAERRFGRGAAAVVAAAVALGFGGGFLTAKVAPSHAGPAEAGAPGGFAWPFFGKLRAANAPRGGAKKPSGFAVWTTRTDTRGAEPLACIRMSRPLDPERSYGDVVQVTPDMGHAPAVSVRGDELCVAGGGFFGHRITLLKGLTAKTGEVLAANADVDFTFGDKPPYVGFEGQGVILPRDESDGLGIETVNVSRLAVEVWRVPDRNLVRKEIAAPDPSDEDSYSGEEDYGEDAPDDSGRVVWKGELAVQGRAGERAVTVFPLGAVLKELKPGAYVVKARDSSGAKGVKAEDSGTSNPAASARRWVLFTDMALMAYSGSDATDVVVRSLKTAKVLSGVRVALVAKDGEDLASATSDAAGRVRFPHALFAGEGASAAKMLMAYGPRADFTALDLNRSPVDLSKADTSGRTDKTETGRTLKAAVDGFLYTDRGIYRPGETVHLVSLLRDAQARALKDRRGALVVRRPSGVEFARIRFDHADSGALTQDLALPKTAPRGRWRVVLDMDGVEEAAGETSFSVEDFAAQRLAVTVNADAQRPVTAGETRRIEVLARFLYGASGSGLQTQGEARLKADPTPFPAFKDYRFGDEQHPFEEKLVEFGAGVTDGAGRAIQSFDAAQAGDTGQPLAVSVVASVFEPGGRPVRESATLKVRTRPLYLGVKSTSEGSGDHVSQSFDFVAVDGAGRRMAAPGTVYTLIAENWDYSWFQKDGRWAWRRTSRDVPIARGRLDLQAADAPARVARRLPWGDYRLEVAEPGGARTVLRLASGWGEPAQGEEAPDTVRVSAGPKTYAQGDTVEVTLKAPYAGEAQVAVATDRLIDFKTVSVGRDGTTVRLKSNAQWGGGAYVLVSVIQPRDPAVTPKPRRALGVVYVPLEPRGRKLTVAFAAKPKLDSKAPVEVPITVQGLKLGAKAHVTIAAVDEGILRLTHEENPDPAKWYFGRRALTLDYRDDYGRLLDPNLGAATAVKYGGDEIGGAGLTVTPIKTVALWSGVVDTDRFGHATVKLPAASDFNGQLRLVAVAWNDDQVGSGVSEVIVREPVVAELSLPRFLAPGDHAFATLELHNVEARAGAYMAEVFGSNGLMAPLRKLFQLLLGQRVVERTPLNAPSVAGIGSVGLKVSGPGFATAKSWPLQTRLGWGPVTRATIAPQKPGEAYTPSPDLLRGLAAGTLSMTVSYSPFRGFDPAPLAEALSRYPYGCTEQLVSAAYPLLYAAEVSRDPKLRRAPAGLLNAATSLLDRQSLDGAFGLWKPGDGEADAWLGAYATDFLLSAKALGASVPDDALNRAIVAMRAISRPAGFVSSGYRVEYPTPWFVDAAAAKVASDRLRSRSAAYALYVLAKAGQGDLSRLRWFHDVQMKDEPSPLARAQVGAGLALMGDRARARDSFVQAGRALGFKDPDDTYQSELRDLGGVIALAYESGEGGVARALQGRLQGVVRDPGALNTQEQAFLMRAAHAMLQAAGPVSVQASGAKGLGGGPRWAVGRLADARFVNTGRGVVWRTVTVRGVPTAAPGASASGLTVEKSLFTLQGERADPGALAQGARVVVRLAGDSRQARTMMAVIDDALPAGWEVETVLSPEDAKTGPFKFLGELTAVSVQEKRDDRYVAAMSLAGNKPYAVAYIARAVTPGDFLLPGAEARDMYHATVAARSAAGRVRIAAGP